MYTVKQAKRDYQAELKTAQNWRSAGKSTVDAATAGSKLANGREEIPIDEYIAMWQEGLNKLNALEDQDAEAFNY